MSAACIAIVLISVVALNSLIFLFLEDDPVSMVNRLMTIGIVVTVFRVLTVVVFLMWTYRCAVNALSLAGNRMQHSPGKAVWSYFVPIYWFFGPYISLKEIVVLTYRHSERSSPEPIMLLWWIPWVCSFFVTIVFSGVNALGIALALLVVSGVSLIIIILKLSTAQAEIRIRESAPVPAPGSAPRAIRRPGPAAPLPKQAPAVSVSANVPRSRRPAPPPPKPDP